MNLPIDVIPLNNPPRFKWTQVVDTPIGPKIVEHEGMLSPSVEDAVVLLIGIAKRQAQEIKGLQRMNELHCERIAAQSDLLSKKAEIPVAPQVSSLKKK